MSDILKLGPYLLIVGLLFGGMYLYGEKTGESTGAKKATGKISVYRDKEPALFAENQRGLKQWCFCLVPIGAACTLIRVVQKMRAKE
ncbi:MAG TPA: hypothetical protein PLQ52_07650 [Lacunisphaera sp.]|jgi:hypothetical protein|nr:hypothetical protein [Lacunisphaera sp.]HQY05924.1 hypothetical protein [Lacunisphaera sp.]